MGSTGAVVTAVYVIPSERFFFFFLFSFYIIKYQKFNNKNLDNDLQRIAV